MNMFSLRLESNAKENFTTIDGTVYATGKDGKGLYQLIDPEIAYFPGETALIDENFKFNKKVDSEQQIRKAIANSKQSV